jgi:hypothetical protein
LLNGSEQSECYQRKVQGPSTTNHGSSHLLAFRCVLLNPRGRSLKGRGPAEFSSKRGGGQPFDRGNLYKIFLRKRGGGVRTPWTPSGSAPMLGHAECPTKTPSLFPAGSEVQAVPKGGTGSSGTPQGMEPCHGNSHIHSFRSIASFPGTTIYRRGPWINYITCLIALPNTLQYRPCVGHRASLCWAVLWLLKFHEGMRVNPPPPPPPPNRNVGALSGWLYSSILAIHKITCCMHAHSPCSFSVALAIDSVT